MKEISIYEYLRSQFSDLAGAQVFFRKFCDEMDQEIPGHGVFSKRAMAAYCSAVLENTEVCKTGEESVFPSLIDMKESKYGAAIYRGRV